MTRSVVWFAAGEWLSIGMSLGGGVGSKTRTGFMLTAWEPLACK